MDLSILTTVFCFISLVLGFTALNALSNLKAKVNAHLDRTDLHSEKLATILSILQQIEAKQDLMFNNAPPFPGEPITEQEPIYEHKEYGIRVPARIIQKDGFGTHWVIDEAKELEAKMYDDLCKSADEHEWLRPDLPCSFPRYKSPLPIVSIPLNHMPKARKPRKDAGVKRGPYKKATAQ